MATTLVTLIDFQTDFDVKSKLRPEPHLILFQYSPKPLEAQDTEAVVIFPSSNLRCADTLLEALGISGEPDVESALVEAQAGMLAYYEVPPDKRTEHIQHVFFFPTIPCKTAEAFVKEKTVELIAELNKIEAINLGMSLICDTDQDGRSLEYFMRALNHVVEKGLDGSVSRIVLASSVATEDWVRSVVDPLKKE
ncbi:MAG: hypothetical protein NUW37_13120 [Planctomycetes bacterium]|nr:hypothetical protein [Planctomycetota bacterium]